MKNFFCQTAAQLGTGGSTGKKMGRELFCLTMGPTYFYCGGPGRVTALGQWKSLFGEWIFEPALGLT
jgi:hypothetical protein